jgi:hypothetical protein
MRSIDFAGVLDVLAGQELFLGLFLAGAGVVFMLLGFRMSRTLVAISFGVIGFVSGWCLGGDDVARLGLGMALAVVLGVASTLYLRVSVLVLAGLWAGYVVLLGCGQFWIPLGVQMAIGGLVAVAAAAMGMILHREVTAFVLSFEGSLLFVGALVIFLNQNPVLWGHLRDAMVANPICAPFAVLTGTVTGFYWQMAEMRQRDAGTSS